MVQNITTLTDFLQSSGFKYRVFDMGRRVSKIGAKLFEQIESAHQPYPQPFLRSAMLGVIFWHPAQTEQRYVWFLKFPLDEQGLLDIHARDAFLAMLLERVGESMLAAANGKKLQGALDDSPYSFKPRDDKMAAFNAKATTELNLPPSQYYLAAHDYFTGLVPATKWSNLALQGIADVAMRLSEPGKPHKLLQTLAEIPATPLQSLCLFLENAQPSESLVQRLTQKLHNELNASQPDTALVAAYLRAISNAPSRELVVEVVEQILQHPLSQHVEILAVISGRIWSSLQDLKIARLYVEQLAVSDAGQAGFSQLLADLLFMPGMREPIMQALRHPSRSKPLSQAVGEMFGQPPTLH